MQDPTRSIKIDKHQLDSIYNRAKISGSYMISISLVDPNDRDKIEHHLFTNDYKYQDFFLTLYEIEKLVKGLYDKKNKK